MSSSLFNYLHRIAVATSIVAAVLLTTRTSLGQANLAAEARAAADYLNQIRANPRAFANLSASLADADVEARPALVWNVALQKAAERKAQHMAATEDFAHVMTINGQKVGMNQWMREAGYQLADHFKNDATNLECLYGEGGNDLNGIGRRVMNTFFAEGKDGGHVLPILGRGFWTPCKDIGIGIASRPGGFTYVSVLVGIYDPFNPNAQPPGQPNPVPVPNPNPNPNPNPVPVPNPNPAPQPRPGQVTVAITNASLVTVPVSYTTGGQAAVQLVASNTQMNLSVDASSRVSYVLPSPSGGQILASAATNKLDIPRDASTLKLQNNGPGAATVSIETPVFKDGQYQFAPQAVNMPAPSIISQVFPKGTRVKVQSATAAMARVLQKDEESVAFPPSAEPAPQPAPPVPQPAPAVGGSPVGSYQRDPIENTFHEGTISADPNRAGQFVWTNKAGVSWRMAIDQTGNVLNKEAGSTYQDLPGGNAFTLVRGAQGEISGFKFLGETYRKVR